MFPCSEELLPYFSCRARRNLRRLHGNPSSKKAIKQRHLLENLRKAKKNTAVNEKPAIVKTHIRDMVILPEMIGSVVGVYQGKTFTQVEIKVKILLQLCFMVMLERSQALLMTSYVSL